MITLAREAAGLTQEGLAVLLSISPSKMSKLEAGMVTLAQAELEILAAKLDQPCEIFFLRDQQYGPGSPCLSHYRKRRSMSARDFHRIHATINILRMNVAQLMSGFHSDSPHRFVRIDIDSVDGDAEEVARMARASWRLPVGPIADVTAAAEDAGAVVIRYRMSCDEIDAISQVTPGLPPMIFVNAERSGERMRHSLAHEIGHLFMHAIPSADPESEADRFAAEFLMPADLIRGEFRRPVSIPSLALLKNRWGVSMKSLVYRARSLGVITETQARWLYATMSRMGWSKGEPGALRAEEPRAVRELIEQRTKLHGLPMPVIAELARMREERFREVFLGESRNLRIA